jgi:hypothetical protein
MLFLTTLLTIGGLILISLFLKKWISNPWIRLMIGAIIFILIFGIMPILSSILLTASLLLFTIIPYFIMAFVVFGVGWYIAPADIAIWKIILFFFLSFPLSAFLKTISEIVLVPISAGIGVMKNA